MFEAWSDVAAIANSDDGAGLSELQYVRPPRQDHPDWSIHRIAKVWKATLRGIQGSSVIVLEDFNGVELIDRALASSTVSALLPKRELLVSLTDGI